MEKWMEQPSTKQGDVDMADIRNNAWIFNDLKYKLYIHICTNNTVQLCKITANYLQKWTFHYFIIQSIYCM